MEQLEVTYDYKVIVIPKTNMPKSLAKDCLIK